MGSRLSRFERHSTFSFLGEFQVANVLCGGAGQGRTVTGPKLGLGKLGKVRWGCSRDPGRNGSLWEGADQAILDTRV